MTERMLMMGNLKKAVIAALATGGVVAGMATASAAPLRSSSPVAATSAEESQLHALVVRLGDREHSLQSTLRARHVQAQGAVDAPQGAPETTRPTVPRPVTPGPGQTAPGTVPGAPAEGTRTGTEVEVTEPTTEPTTGPGTTPTTEPTTESDAEPPTTTTSTTTSSTTTTSTAPTGTWSDHGDDSGD